MNAPLHSWAEYLVAEILVGGYLALRPYFWLNIRYLVSGPTTIRFISSSEGLST